MLYRNNKTGKVYEIPDINNLTIINTTNEQDGQEMILYRESDDLLSDKIFVREKEEFFNKFTKI